MRSTRLRIWKLTGNECVDATAHDERHSGHTTVAAEDDDDDDEEEDDDDDDEAGGEGVAASRMLVRMSERTQASQKVCATEANVGFRFRAPNAETRRTADSRGGTARRPDLGSGRDRWST